MVIMHNMKAMNAERQLNVVTADKAKSTEKLSSGYQINRSANDAAGLSISEKMRHQIRGLNRGSDNIEDGVGYCQVADGALNEMHDMLQRMNELCIQGANGTLSDSDRLHINDEVQQLKDEIQRICDTTKFNEEYIFRCEDVMPEESHDVYKLSFSGTPKDLFVYESNEYDEKNKNDDGEPYAGICYRGRRYTWEEINPRMYDPATRTFREGEYTIKSDADDTVLTLICEDGAKLPQVSRKYTTTADGRGVYVNNEFAASWSELEKNNYTFTYHGVQVSFTVDDEDTFEDKVLKMTGTVWESTYVAPVQSKALDAYFTPYKYYFNGKNADENVNDRIGAHVRNTNKTTKYILHAEDINDYGTIPVEGGGSVPFDGVWIEETDTNWEGTRRALWKMTWGEFKERTEAEQNKLDTIPGTSNFGFTCDKDSTKHDWSNLSTDIWVGNNRTEDPKSTYPPESGSSDFASYDPYNTFSFFNPEDNNENVRFIFSVINEISKTEAVKALDGVKIGYTKFEVYNHGEVQNANASGKINSATVGVKLELDGEYYLGRDYDNWNANYDGLPLTGPAKLNYTEGGGFSIEYAYKRTSGSLRYTMTSGAVETLISNMAKNLTKDVFDKTIQTNVLPSRSIALTLNPNSSQMSGAMTLTYTYNLSGFGTPVLNYTDNGSTGTGDYVRRKNGTYEKYTNSVAQRNELNNNEAVRCDAYLTGTGGVRLEDYLRTTVMQDIADNTTVSLHVDNYPSAVLSANENPNSVGVTRWQTPFQHPHVIPPEEPPEKPEYLRIQCSSNVSDTIWIQKQKLSVYRLGLTHVELLSESQATGNIDIVGNALAKISSIRSLFGAEQNRLEHAYNINRNSHENTQQAESKIRDTDMAKEMIRYSNASILEQSGNSMLVQANQANNIVLSLLN